MQTMKIIFKRILSNNSINQNFNTISEHLKQLKDKFFDNQFPPNENSLIKGFKLSTFKNNLKLYLKFIKKTMKDIFVFIVHYYIDYNGENREKSRIEIIKDSPKIKVE